MNTELSTNVKGKEVAAHILPKLFSDINFEELNGVIEKLATVTQLSDKQREDAIDIVDDWSRSVIKRLEHHEVETKAFISFITDKTNSFRGYSSDPLTLFGEDRLTNMAAATSTKELFSTYLDMRDHYDEIDQNQPAEENFRIDPDLTMTQITEKEMEALKEKKLYEIKKTRARNEEIKALRAWTAALNKNEGIREMVNKARRYTSQVKLFTEECRSKAQAAKLNLTIPDSNIRTALKELISFSSKI